MNAPRPAFKPGTGPARRRRIVLAVMVGFAALWLAAVSRIHVNASWSDGAWGYAAFPLFGQEPQIGDRVLFEPPEGAWAPGSGAGAGSFRSGVGSRVPYLKTVRGVPGMRISVSEDGTVALDGAPVGRAKAQALDGRPLAAIAPGAIPPGHFFLHADHRDSHDSRYAEIGLVPRDRILGRAIAMPDFPWLGLKGPLVGPEDAGRPDGAATIMPYPADTPPPAREPAPDWIRGPGQAPRDSRWTVGAPR